jgi:CAAX protease family protein
MAQRDISRQDKTSPVTDRIRTKLVSLKTISRPIALGYLAGLITAEAITVWGSPLVGAILYAVFLFLLLTQAYRATRSYQRLFYSSVALVPLIRLLSLVLPLQSLPRFAWYPLVTLPLTLAVWQVARLNRVRSGMLGLSTRGLPMQLLIGLTGLVIGLVQYLILRPPPLLEETGWIILFVLPLTVLLLVFSAFLEEFIFRGLIQYSALRNLGWFGLVFSSVLYASLFLGYFSLLNLFFVFFVGLLFGGLAIRTGSILGVSLSHALVNVLVFMFFPYLVSLPFFQGRMAGGSVPLQTMTPIPAFASSTPIPTGPVVTQTPCPAPIGWVPYLVEPGDTLESLNQMYGSTLDEFLRANCLTEVAPLQVGQRLNVPPATTQPDSLIPGDSLTLAVPSPTASPTGTEVPTETSPPPTQELPTPSPTPQPTEPPPPPPPPPTPTLQPTEPPPPTQTSLPPTSTSLPPSPTEPPPPTNTPPPPTMAPTPTLAPTQLPPTQRPTPTPAPTDQVKSSNKPIKLPAQPIPSR